MFESFALASILLMYFLIDKNFAYSVLLTTEIACSWVYFATTPFAYYRRHITHMRISLHTSMQGAFGLVSCFSNHVNPKKIFGRIMSMARNLQHRL